MGQSKIDQKLYFRYNLSTPAHMNVHVLYMLLHTLLRACDNDNLRNDGLFRFFDKVGKL